MTPDAAAASITALAAKPIARCVPRTVFRIFVVEGQTAERTVLGQLIRRNPSLQIAGEARTADQALAMLSAASAPPDIVCTSWLLDGGDAGRWAFVEEVRRRCPEARLMMTCPDERDEVLRAALGEVLAREYLLVKRSEVRAFEGKDIAFELAQHFYKY